MLFLLWGEPVIKFPVFKSVGEVFSGVTRHYFELILAAPLPVFLYAATNVAITCLSDSPATKSLKPAETPEELIAYAPFLLAIIAALIVYYVSAVVSAVRWHRFVLIGERNAPVWSRYDGRYMWTNIKMLLAMIGMALISVMFFTAGRHIFSSQAGLPVAMQAIGGAGLAVLFFMFLAWAVRVSLAFPDAAMGGSGKIGDALSRTAGYSWKLIVYFLLILLPLGFVLSVITKLLEKLFIPAFAAGVPDLIGYETIAAEIILLPLSVYVLMINVTMLSVAYREIIGLPTAPLAEPV